MTNRTCRMCNKPATTMTLWPVTHAQDRGNPTFECDEHAKRFPRNEQVGLGPISYGNTSRGFEVTFEGRTVIMGRPNDLAELRQHITERTDRMAEEARRLRMLSVLADAMEAERDQNAAKARDQRNAKAAATRAHNKDPFGFAAITH